MVSLPASDILGLLTDQELRLLQGHGDFSTAPGDLSSFADCERAGLSRDDFLSATHFLNYPSGPLAGGSDLGIFSKVEIRHGWSLTGGVGALAWLGSPQGIFGNKSPLPFAPELLMGKPRSTAVKIPAPLLEDWRRIGMIALDLVRQFDSDDTDDQRGILFGLLMVLPQLCL